MSLPDFPPAFYPVAVFAILITGVAKGGFAAGSGGLAVPLMSMFIAPAEAAGIMLPILCVMDVLGLRAYRGKWDWQSVKHMMLPAILGIVIGGPPACASVEVKPESPHQSHGRSHSGSQVLRSRSAGINW